MPQMDGYALVQALHQDTRLKSIPVIVLTGRGEMVELFKLAEIYNFLIKPVEPAALLAMIHKVLGKGEYAQPPNAESFISKIGKMEDILAKKKFKDPLLKDSLEQLRKVVKKKP
jgi:CheY-like chemotaxis protein